MRRRLPADIPGWIAAISVPPTQAATGFPLIPGRPLPDGMLVPFYDYDFGPAFRSPDVSGIVTLQPPVVRQTLPTLVPRVDEDGNEMAGVRSVLLQAPLGTYTGWNPDGARILQGPDSSRWAAATSHSPGPRPNASLSGDPRPSLEERYASHDGYVAQVRAAAKRLVEEGFLLQDDADRLIAQAENSSVLR